MTWFAIEGPDGEILAGSIQRSVESAWDTATYGLKSDHPLYIEWRDHEYPGDFAEAGESLGYRCVEVQLVEPGTAEALERARKAWGSLAGVGASVGVYNPGSGCARIVEDAMQVLEEVLGEVESTAPTGGAESKEDGK